MANQEKEVAQFTIHYTQYLDKHGNPTQPLPSLAEDPKQLVNLYRSMLVTRAFDEKSVKLQRMGKLGTFPSVLGQEAIGVGVGSVMRKEDVLCPNYRDYGAQFSHGVSMSELLVYWGGDERGSNFAKARQDFPVCIPIASQALHAVGAATAIKLRKESRVVVVMLGDGATSRGDFYEAMNVAGVWDLPVVFVVNNNQWAISMRREEQSRTKTLAQKGIAAGIWSEQIDGNDVFAVHEVTQAAIERAREAKGPTLIEALSYRMGDHTTADDASRYRDPSELEQHREEDPIKRLRYYLEQKGWWNDQKEQELHKEIEEEIETAVKEYLSNQPNTPESMFDHLFEKLPEPLVPQKEAVKRLYKGSKDE